MFPKLYWSIAFLALAAGIQANDKKTMTLTEDLRFGATEADSEYTWSDGQFSCFFDVDERGHFFVVDTRNSFIFEFDEKGKLVGTLAKQGNGPGEFQRINAFAVHKDGSALGLDGFQGTTKASYFDPGPKFRETKVINGLGFIFKAHLGPDQSTAQTIEGSASGQTMKLQLLDKDFKPIQTFKSIDWPQIDPNKAGEQSAWVDYLQGQFKGFFDAAGLAVCILADGRVVVGDAVKGSYTVYAKGGTKQLKTLNVGLVPSPFNDAEKQELTEAISEIIFKQGGPAFRDLVTPAVIQRALDQANLPDRQLAVYDLIPIEGNLVGAVTLGHFASGELELTLIDIEKGIVGKTTLPDRGIFSLFGTRLFFKKGYAYAMAWTAEDENQIVRYKYQLSP